MDEEVADDPAPAEEPETEVEVEVEVESAPAPDLEGRVADLEAAVLALGGPDRIPVL